MTPTEPRTDLRALVMQAISSFVEPNQRLDGTLDMDDPRGIHVDEPDDIPMFLDKIIGVFLDRLAAAESQRDALDALTADETSVFCGWDTVSCHYCGGGDLGRYEHEENCAWVKARAALKEQPR